ncbi:hypothetical protein EW145_g1352 [Phellinidium pouzarii]|uniref:Utp14-domain-containing protein n=1 Tax=Phellinidium pouzarii TaxID=167371 RepID=A0A4S4LFF2_9AGAM|nr:hypothetical protein EW145_g1352 [Phellinidium pouzarii]
MKRGVAHRSARGASRPSSRLENAAGFAKRRAHTAKAAEDADVYDYHPGKSRRANVSLALDDDESRGAGYDDGEDGDEGEDEDRTKRMPRLVGEGEEDERIGSDEDEEIDSDAAFDESDEERFAEFSFKEKKGPAKSRKVRKISRIVRFAEVDLDEDDDAAQGSEIDDASQASSEDDEEEGEDDEFLDVLDVLDGRGDPDSGDDIHEVESKDILVKSSVKMAEPMDEDGPSDVDAEMDEDEVGSSEGDSEQDEIEDIEISGSDEDEADLSALDDLDKLVSGLETSAKRKAADEDELNGESFSIPQIKKKKRLFRDRTEAGAESEFGARIAGSSKLSLDDLLTPLASKPSVLSSLKKSVKPLASSSGPKNQPLPAPLPTRTQEKLDREAAYEQTKQEVDKWSETMKRIKEAEHLSFPLQASKTVRVSNLELTAKFKPTTELESSIDRLLKSAKLREEDINKTEDLLMKDLSVEEVAARRAELRQMRELAFRADAKAKRVSKIKSKAFRRIQKKERLKLLAKLDVDGEGMGDPEEERMKAELDRARERATLKHKNTGKWAKSMKARGELDVDQRRDINAMLERGERLRRRIQGVGSGSEDGVDSSDDDLGDDGVMRVKANAFEELERLRTGTGGDEVEDSDSKMKAKSVFEMKFMKDAAARQNQAVDRMIDDFRREVGDLPEGSDNDAREDDYVMSTPVERTNGRMVFRPGPQAQTSKMLPPPPPSAVSETSTLQSHDSYVLSPDIALNDIPASASPALLPSSALNSATAAEEPNPWLALSGSAPSSQGALQKQLKKGAEERERETDDAVVEISAADVLVLNDPKKTVDSTSIVTAVNGAINDDDKKNKKEKKKPKKEKGKESLHTDEDVDVNSEVEEQETALTKGEKVKAFEQRELVARAFAGDNVVRHFEEAKRKEIEADAPREVDTTLPGWGSWGGSGIDPKSRADYGKAHVIISERRDKKASKYAVRDLPYPYTSKAQFEARMSVPLGTEWNTRLGFQRGTLPRVVKKMGTVIDPLEKL